MTVKTKNNFPFLWENLNWRLSDRNRNTDFTYRGNQFRNIYFSITSSLTLDWIRKWNQICYTTVKKSDYCWKPEINGFLKCTWTHEPFKTDFASFVFFFCLFCNSPLNCISRHINWNNLQWLEGELTWWDKLWNRVISPLLSPPISATHFCLPTAWFSLLPLWITLIISQDGGSSAEICARVKITSVIVAQRSQ